MHIEDISAKTVAHAFVERWVLNFGCHSTITTNHGHQFESGLFRCLTTRFYQQLKASFSAAIVLQWIDALPRVLLSICNAVRSDIGHAIARVVHVMTPQLSGKFADPSSTSITMDQNSYMSRLTDAIRSVKPVSTRLQSTGVFV